MKKRIGLISGNGEFPLVFVEKLKSQGFSVFVCAFKGETDPVIEEFAQDVSWVYVGQIKKIIKYFNKNDISQAVMLGGIKKTRLFFDVRPDSLAIKTLAKLKNTHDDNLLKTFASIMEDNGIAIKSSWEFIPDLLAKKGIWTKRKPTKDNFKDIWLGYKTAKQIGSLDIGQTIITAGGSVVAVEAVEGTDEAIKRGGILSNKGGVVVKVSKPNQDLRFDIPAIGPGTMHTMKEAGINVLAVESKRTNILDFDKVVKLADEFKISIIAVDDDFFREKGFE